MAHLCRAYQLYNSCLLFNYHHRTFARHSRMGLRRYCRFHQSSIFHWSLDTACTTNHLSSIFTSRLLSGGQVDRFLTACMICIDYLCARIYIFDWLIKVDSRRWTDVRIGEWSTELCLCGRLNDAMLANGDRTRRCHGLANHSSTWEKSESGGDKKVSLAGHLHIYDPLTALDSCHWHGSLKNCEGQDMSGFLSDGGLSS